MTRPPADHPIWKTLHYGVLLLIAGGVLWANASSFDSTEIVSLIEMAIGAAVLGGAKAYVTSKGKPPEDG